MDTFSLRIDSTLKLPEVLSLTAEAFDLGSIRRTTPILTGYQDCNIDVSTSSGRYVIKIFSKEKSKKRIDDILWGYTHLAKRSVSFPNLRVSRDGHHTIEIPGSTHPSFLCVFEYFEGKPLTQTPITDADLFSIAQTLAEIHKTPKIIDRYYDNLGIVNIANEFDIKSDALFAEEISLIQPVISKLKRLDILSFRRSIIHGSMERENVLKNSEGKLCILDLGCMDYNASVLDVAALIANFTVYIDETKRNHVIECILEGYQKIHPLSHEELAALPTLIRAQFVAYIIGMTYHMRKDHDMTKQTQIWLDRGWGGLKSYQKVRNIS